MIRLFEPTGLNVQKRFSEVQFYLHLRPVLLLSAARRGRHFKFSLKMFLSCLFPRKTDPQSSNYLKYRREYVFRDCE